MKKERIKNILKLVIVIILLNALFSIKGTYSKGNISYKKEYVSFGDTLWSIAERESKSNKYYQDKDIRYIIYDLKQINNLHGSNLSEGQEIKIPKI